MDSILVIFVFALISILKCHAEISWQDKLNLLMRRNLVSAEEPEAYVSRRLYDFHAGMRSPIIGAPSMPSHLPEAEPILPGHTFLRPALGMLKSAVKFPHKDLGDASGVYGNLNHLGLTYSGTGERVLYTGFRRRNEDFNREVKNDSPRHNGACRQGGVGGIKKYARR